MAHRIHVVFSDRTQQEIVRSFYLMSYFGENGVAFDSSRLENIKQLKRYSEGKEWIPDEVGAFIDETFIAYGVIMNNREMDKRIRKIRESQIAQMAASV